jgi:hypothetical protein
MAPVLCALGLAGASVLLAGASSSDPRALIIAQLADICRRETGLELKLRDLGYDPFSRKTVLDGLVLEEKDGAPVAKAARVVLIADVFSMGAGGPAVADLVRIEKGDLVVDADKAGKPDKADKREARLASLIVKESRLQLFKAKKLRVELTALELKGTALGAGAAGWATGVIEGSAVARLPEHKIDAAPITFGMKLGTSVELRLEGPAGSCGAEKTFTMAELTDGKLDAAALIRDAVLPCPKKPR